jgi:glycosyltransferase involved in cell wall biosynthesis
LAGVRKRLAMIEGAGYVFIDDEKQQFRRALLRKLVQLLYRLALSYAHYVFLLNKDDRNLFIREGMVSADKVRVLDGIGLDIKHFDLSPPVAAPITFILVARLLREKGIFEYIDAARKIKKCHSNVTFLLIGNIDVNPGSINASQVAEWVEDGIVEWPGQVSDIRPWLQRASVFVLPSYREGMPRSTQEAMSMGRPVITTDVPGCRDTVDNGSNGFIIPPRDSSALAEAMITFIEHPELISSMGARSREIAESRFDVTKINAQIMEMLRLY